VAELFSGMGGGLVMTLTSVMILDLTKGENERGKFTATHNFIIGIVTFVGAIITGGITQILAGSLGEIPAVLFMLYIAAGVRFITAFLFFKIPETLESAG
jgi:MFS family permease